MNITTKVNIYSDNILLPPIMEIEVEKINNLHKVKYNNNILYLTKEDIYNILTVNHNIPKNELPNFIKKIDI